MGEEVPHAESLPIPRREEISSENEKRGEEREEEGEEREEDEEEEREEDEEEEREGRGEEREEDEEEEREGEGEGEEREVAAGVRRKGKDWKIGRISLVHWRRRRKLKGEGGGRGGKMTCA